MEQHDLFQPKEEINITSLDREKAKRIYYSSQHMLFTSMTLKLLNANDPMCSVMETHKTSIVY